VMGVGRCLDTPYLDVCVRAWREALASRVSRVRLLRVLGARPFVMLSEQRTFTRAQFDYVLNRRRGP